MGCEGRGDAGGLRAGAFGDVMPRWNWPDVPRVRLHCSFGSGGTTVLPARPLNGVAWRELTCGVCGRRMRAKLCSRATLRREHLTADIAVLVAWLADVAILAYMVSRQADPRDLVIVGVATLMIGIWTLRVWRDGKIDDGVRSIEPVAEDRRGPETHSLR